MGEWIDGRGGLQTDHEQVLRHRARQVPLCGRSELKNERNAHGMTVHCRGLNMPIENGRTGAAGLARDRPVFFFPNGCAREQNAERALVAIQVALAGMWCSGPGQACH